MDTFMDKKKSRELKKFKESGFKSKLSPLWKEDKVKQFLYQSQGGKCCYCERKRDEKAETDVEHFRPKAKLQENPKHSGYWWLAYSWDNLLISCKKCNNRKSSRFPLKDESKRADSENSDLNKEEPVLINPLTESPENFIKYDIPQDSRNYPLMIKAVGKCERSDKTVNKLTGINDKELLEERAAGFKDYRNLYAFYKILQKESDSKSKRKALETVRKEIKKKTESRSQFAGLARFYFHQAGLSDI